LENNIIGQLHPPYPISKIISDDVKSTNRNEVMPTIKPPVTEKTFNVECLELVKEVNCSHLINI